MAGELKQEFIEAVRLTPDGINDFLETPIPAAPTIGTPTDKDSAIIANGVLSKFLLDLFAPFAGLTPVELLLRIGQHNSVLESAMIAGLEYLEGSDSDEQGLQFIEPTDGGTYSPGEMRFTVAAQNGTPGRVNLTVDGGDPVKMTTEDKGATWRAFQSVDAGEHTAECSAQFDGSEVKIITCVFTITAEGEEPPPGEDPPEQPEGTDDEALDRLHKQILTAYRQLLSFGNLGDPDEYKTRMSAFTAAVSQFLSSITATSPGIAATKQRITDLLNDITTILERSPLTTADLEDATNCASAIMNNINMLKTLLA